MKSDCPNLVNWQASWVVVCPRNVHRELIRMDASIIILDWSMDAEENHDVLTGNSIWIKHCCYSTHSPPIEWGCKVIYTQHMCNCSSHANHYTGYSVCKIACRYHIISLAYAANTSNRTKVSTNPLSMYRISSKYQRKAGWTQLHSLSLSQVGFMDQRWSETPQIVLPELDTRSPSFQQRLLLRAIYSITLRLILCLFLLVW